LKANGRKPRSAKLTAMIELSTLVFATGSIHKMTEVRALYDGFFAPCKSLKDIEFTDALPETSDTILGNSQQKAWYLYEKTGMNCFSEDTGLEVEALGGEPGVYTARYSGANATDSSNINLLLDNLQKIEKKVDRNATFRTIITLIVDSNAYSFEGTCAGRIALKPQGENGFGYDPIFIPNGHEQSFAELGNDVKNKISHRANAFEKLKNFLQQDTSDNNL
jgi:XTP/dITP diphosphohydrolase